MGMQRHRSGGFTLIELLVVLAIIGALCAIAIPQFAGREGKAFDARITQDCRATAAAEELWFTDHSSYYEGPCDAMPGVQLSPGTVCTAELSGGGFRVTTTHPQATKQCVWTSEGVPTLVCS
jgi:prepilin-type N-terminal cleavage/methylation domain-containing protein